MLPSSLFSCYVNRGLYSRTHSKLDMLSRVLFCFTYLVLVNIGLCDCKRVSCLLVFSWYCGLVYVRGSCSCLVHTSPTLLRTLSRIMGSGAWQNVLKIIILLQNCTKNQDMHNSYITFILVNPQMPYDYNQKLII